MKTISIIFGTRPEAIKLCPLIIEMKKDPEINCKVCSTGQHRQMLDQILEAFDVKPEIDLQLMQPNQTLGQLTSRMIASLDNYLKETHPDIIVVQGDTTTVLCGALTAFYNGIPIAHVEAGLRTWNMYSPWPEEANRVLTSKLAQWHFAPTQQNYQNLLLERIPAKDIYVVGNTVIDALRIAQKRIREFPPEILGLPENNLNYLKNRKMVLITGHRRENFGEGFENICYAIKTLSERFPEVEFIYPVHLNPNVQVPVHSILAPNNLSKSNIHLIEPQAYLPFISLMDRANIILTDSGGVQEEAPSLGKPVLVMRNTTERPEAMKAGAAKLVGTVTKDIVDGVSQLLTDVNEYNKMAHAVNPYGDGKAVERIIKVLKQS